jgi:hypothetical protein
LGKEEKEAVPHCPLQGIKDVWLLRTITRSRNERNSKASNKRKKARK